MTPARVVFPTPPFPEIAIFIFSSGHYHNQKIIKCLLWRMSCPLTDLNFPRGISLKVSFCHPELVSGSRHQLISSDAEATLPRRDAEASPA
jgi:hypothetical protein